MWAGMPLAVRVVVAAAVTVFAYGTAVHLGQLAAGGWHPYRGLPGWLAGYFVALTVLDPVAAGLLACRRAGLVLGCAVLLSDAAGNGYADYAIRPGQGITAGRAGQAVVTVLAIALLAAAPRVWPWLRPTSRATQRCTDPAAGQQPPTAPTPSLTKAKQPAQHTHAPQLTGTAPESAVSAGTCREPATYVTFVANPQERRPAITHTL